MPGALRSGISTAGGVIAGSGVNVLVNGVPAVTAGDPVAPHAPGIHLAAKMVSTSRVLVNGKPMCKAGDLATCGHPSILGSTNVYIGV